MTFYASIMLFADVGLRGVVSSHAIGNKKNCRNSFKTKDFWTRVRLPPSPPKEFNMMDKQKLIDEIRKTIPNLVAEEICSVQPMPNIDFDALAQSPLWESYVNRHFSHLSSSDGDVMVSTGVASREGDTSGDRR